MRDFLHTGCLTAIFIGLLITGCNSIDSTTQTVNTPSSPTQIRIGTLIQNVPQDIWAPSEYCLEEEVPALQPGASYTYTLPMIQMKGEGTDRLGKYVFSSLILKENIELGNTKLSFELDIPYYKLGVREGYPNYRKLK